MTDNNLNATDKTVAEFTPRRSLIAWLSGLLLIALCLNGIAMFIVAFFEPPSFAMLLAFPAIPVFVIFVFLQFHALFCRKPGTDYAYSGCLLTIGGLALYVAMASFTDIVVNSHEYWLWGTISVVGVLFTTLGICCVFDWNKRRSAAKEITPLPGQVIGWRYCLGMICMAGIVVALSAYYVSTLPPILVEHVSYDELPYLKPILPKEGSDFSYRRRARGSLYYDFAISEDGFRRWAESRDHGPIREIEAEKSIPRYTRTQDGSTGDIIVTDGLIIHRGSDSIGAYTVFDRETDRAYYWSYY